MEQFDRIHEVFESQYPSNSSMEDSGK